MVLIKGMKMPKPKLAGTVYHAYVIVRPNGHAEIVVDNEDGLDSTAFPLVPVPPHGRLIDADVMRTKIDGNGDSLKRAIVEWVDAQETVIEAEEGE